MPRITTELLEFIKQFEGLSESPYLCPAGYWTIGYGHVISADEASSIVKADASAINSWLLHDVQIAASAVNRLIKIVLSDNQFAALVSFTFNLGAGALQRSALRRKINNGEYAADEFMRWVWAGGRRLPGLIKRRQAEATLYCRP